MDGRQAAPLCPNRFKPLKRFRAVVALLLLFLIINPAVAVGASGQYAGPGAEPVLKADPLWSVDRARSGDRIGLALVLQIAPGFHINADADQLATYPTFTPYPTRIQIIEISPGVAMESPQFPRAHTIEVDFAPER